MIYLRKIYDFWGISKITRGLNRQYFINNHFVNNYIKSVILYSFFKYKEIWKGLKIV